MNIEPLHDRVLIKPNAAAECPSAGGILLPADPIKTNNVLGTVVAAGAGRITNSGETVPLSIKVGDTVICPRNTGHLVDIGGEIHFCMRESEIVARVVSTPSA